MDYLNQIQRGIEYIEANLDTDLSPGDVARQAGISQWHFQRIFKALTNETLKTYIRARRMAGAVEALESTQARVIEIALQAGFETQESFTRAFKTTFGVTPAVYRKHRTRLPFLRKVRIDAEYLTHIHQSISLQPAVYHQPALDLVGMHTRFFGVDSEKNNMAQKLPALWQQMLARLESLPWTNKTGYGVIQQTAEQTDELDYFASVELSPVPPDMIQVVIPESQYAKFAHRGLVSNLDRTVNYIYSTWLTQSSYRHTYGPDLEIYGSQYIPDSEESVIYYAIPISR